MAERVVALQNIKEAFEYLSPEVQEHSRRVSRYAEVLFTQIVMEDLYSETGAGRRYLQAENKDVVAEAALYHDIGKAYVPPLYQQSHQNFTAEEVAVYRQHIPDGMTLMTDTMPGFKKRPATERNILTETIRDHNEYCDGSGFPEGKTQDAISYVGRIVCLVNEFDHLCMSIVSEDPVEEAVARMQGEGNEKYDPEFFKMFLLCKGKFKRIFATNSAGSLVIPTVDTFVRRRIRPMELAYRPILGAGKQFLRYDCKMLFSNGKENVWHYDDVRHIISKQSIAVDLCNYFAYEACDALRRFQIYEIPHNGVTLTMLPLFFSKKSNVRDLLTILENEEMDVDRFRIGVPAELFEKPSKAMVATLAECREVKLGCIVTGLDFRMVEPQVLKDCGVTTVRLNVASDDEMNMPHFTQWVQDAQQSGIVVSMDGLDKTRQLQKLETLGIFDYTGTLAGDFESEKTILQREIAMRQMQADSK